MLKIRVKKVRPSAQIPKQASVGDWIDLYTAEEITIEAGEYKRIPLGIAMDLPFGYEAHIVPRSSTFEKWGVIQTNSMGVIDNCYCGDNDEWQMPVYATRDVTIPVGTRLCQFRLSHVQTDVRLFECATLGNFDRGGFGSTGEK